MRTRFTNVGYSSALSRWRTWVCGCTFAAFWLVGCHGATSEDISRQAALATLDKPVRTVLAEDTALVRAAARIEPAVVNIDTPVTGSSRTRDWFGASSIRSFAMEGKGSGVIISPNGYIVTNNHVVEGARIIKVTLPTGREFDGRVIGADPVADLAVVKVDAANLPAAELGDSDALKVGQYVLAIGYPLGIGTTVTHGIVSATDRRDIDIDDSHRLKQVIQTDAPINRGNSGGALANLDGQLVGINTAIATENNGGNIGIGFAIPIASARSVVRGLIARGKPAGSQRVAPFLGISDGAVPPDMAHGMGITGNQGVVVAAVLPLTSAARADIKRQDIILRLDNHIVHSPTELQRMIALHSVGDSVKLTIRRGLLLKHITVVLGTTVVADRPSQ